MHISFVGAKVRSFGQFSKYFVKKVLGGRMGRGDGKEKVDILSQTVTVPLNPYQVVFLEHVKKSGVFC